MKLPKKEYYLLALTQRFLNALISRARRIKFPSLEARLPDEAGVRVRFWCKHIRLKSQKISFGLIIIGCALISSSGAFAQQTQPQKSKN